MSSTTSMSMSTATLTTTAAAMSSQRALDAGDELPAMDTHILSAGFSRAQWSDVTVVVASAAGWKHEWALHAIVLARSPVLARCLPDSRHLWLELYLDDASINLDAVHICLAHIYGAPRPEQVDPATARALLSIASLLELNSLADWALSQSISSLAPKVDVLLQTASYVSSSAAALASASASSSSNGQPGSSSRAAYLVVHDRWAALLHQAGSSAGRYAQSTQPSDEHQHRNISFSAASEHSVDVSGASSPNTFDPTAPAVPPSQIQNGDARASSWQAPSHDAASGPPGLTKQKGAHEGLGHANGHGGEHGNGQGSPSFSSLAHLAHLAYPPSYSTRLTALREALFTYLASSLPLKLGAFLDASATDKLLGIYAGLEYELFREVMQSPILPVRSVQERFAFAKRCIAVRNKAHAASHTHHTNNTSSPTSSTGSGHNSQPGPDAQTEEQVVLAFGGTLQAGGPSAPGLSFGGGGGGAGSVPTAGGAAFTSAHLGGGGGPGGAEAGGTMGGTVQIFRKPARTRRYAKASAALG